MVHLPAFGSRYRSFNVVFGAVKAAEKSSQCHGAVSLAHIYIGQSLPGEFSRNRLISLTSFKLLRLLRRVADDATFERTYKFPA